MDIKTAPHFSDEDVSAEPRWYTIHTYAGYENAVERNLKQRIESLGMENKIFEVVVPTEKKIRVKGGKRIVEEEKIYPGYILVRMTVDEDSWFVVRNTPRVTGFVGAGNTPVPMEESEVTSLMKRMGQEAPKHRIDLMKDDPVVIADGPFKDLEGKVGEIDEERGKVKVMVAMFRRETPVELDY
ncbi:MAG: transcription termination/antitermination protein NusG, partial [Patescibacteria group bacterium]